MSFDRIALIALAVAALSFGAYRAGAADSGADTGTDGGARLTISHVVSGGAADGVSYLWVVDDTHRKVALCTARAGQDLAPICGAAAAMLP